MEKKLWICPNNDLEAKTIIELLERNGEDYIITGQGWGASWEMLEPEVFEQLKDRDYEIEDESIEHLRVFDEKIIELDNEISNLNNQMNNIQGDKKNELKEKINELLSIKSEIIEKRQEAAGEILSRVNKQAYKNSTTIYGVELNGKSRGAIDIDHHGEKSSEKSSIEQVADVLNIDLTLDEKFVAANDKGFIPEMEILASELGISREDLKEIVANIRMRDRKVQGITIEQEAQAQEAIEKLGKIEHKQDYILIQDLKHSKTATVTDRLYGLCENLLITSIDGETNFFGSTEIIDMLEAKFRIEDTETGESKNTWKGGQLDKGSGYWGGYADQERIKEEVQKMIQKSRVEKNDKSLDD